MRVSAVLLAAGASRRFGGPKLLARVDGQPLVAHVARAFLEAGVDELLAVLGARSEEIAAALGGLPVRAVLNEAHEEGMFSSVRAGLAAVDPGSERIAVSPADLPDLGARDISAVLHEACRAPAHALAVASHAGRRGHPLVLSRDVAERVLAWPRDARLDRLFAEPDLAVMHVPCGAGVLHDMDVPADLTPR